MYVHTCLGHQTEFAIQSLATGSHELLKSYAHSNGRAHICWQTKHNNGEAIAMVITIIIYVLHALYLKIQHTHTQCMYNDTNELSKVFCMVDAILLYTYVYTYHCTGR